MKIALNSYTGYGAHFALRLLAEGHSVDYFLSEEKYHPILQGLVKAKLINPDSRKSQQNYINDLPRYEKYDLSVFDLTGKPRQAEVSSSSVPTIGDGSLQTMLEDDRTFGIEMMEAAKINVPPYQRFTDVNEAKSFIKSTGKRYVFKPDGGQDQDTATTYVAKDAEDLIKAIDKLFTSAKGSSFILQEFKTGIEISTEGWFNGTDFYCLNCTLEEKKFMNNGIGPNTGCAGNLVFSISPHSRIFKEGLGKLKSIVPYFRGMIDLNAIVTDDKLYGLEWTPRFGYDAAATFLEMYGGDFGDLLHKIASDKVPENSWRAEFGASVRLTIPPYPTELHMAKKAGIPIKGIDPEDTAQVLKTYMYDVKLDGDQLVTAGVNGFIASPVEIGTTIPEVFGKLEARIKEIQIPDMQYRTDIQKTVSKRYVELQQKGWI